ncbi:MAG: S8 family peptidase [bacterium]|nr:S8 family peptidase [bacterium]
MNKFLFILISTILGSSLWANKPVILLSDKYSNTTMLSIGKGIDTLIPQISAPYSPCGAKWRIEYEATKFTISKPCSIIAILYGVYSQAASSKQCSLFIWKNDEFNNPGEKVFSVSTPLSTTSGGVNWTMYTLPTPVYVDFPFWVGNFESDTSYPTSAMDKTVSFPSKYYDPTKTPVWLDDVGDYLQAVIVKYEDTDPEMSVSPSQLTLQIDSSDVLVKTTKTDFPNPSVPLLKETDKEYWQNIVPGEIIIGYNNNVNVKNATLEELNIPTTKGVSLLNRNLGSNFILIKIYGGIEEEKTFIRSIKNKPNINSVEPNRILQLQTTPNDPYFGQQWDKTNLNASGAWDFGYGSDSISIAILDMGADYTHPDLSGRFSTVKGYDFVDGDNDPAPAGSHGTECSGVAAATINNGIGVAGISNARLYSVRIVSGSTTTDAWLGQGIQWCIDNHVNVISMSNAGGAGQYSMTECQAAWDSGCILVASSGNEGSLGITFPAGYPSVICVGSIGQTNQWSSFSCYGPAMELIAPGEGIQTTCPGGTYGPQDGTSFSCPNVSGCAALVWSANTSLTNHEIRKILNSTATDLGPTGWDNKYGYGKPNLRNAVLIASAPCDSGTITIHNSNSSNANLLVSNITYSSSWIFSVNPLIFSVPNGSSQNVTVTARARLSKGYYYDTLRLSSNFNTTPWLVPVTLKVGNVGIEETHSNTYNFKISPNPTIKCLSVNFDLPNAQYITLNICDIAGRVVKTLANENKIAGNYNLKFTTSGFASGVYFVSLKVGKTYISKKVTIAR